VARESLQVFAPLANRLGIWQVKWEIEDLAFRFLEPETYKLIARLLDEKRIEREGHVEQLRSQLEHELQAGHEGHGAGPAQAHLQHREEDARQVAGLRAGASTFARCAWSCRT
jgi:(p)ppGpp synthase/HD superfamily hydrolase